MKIYFEAALGGKMRRELGEGYVISLVTATKFADRLPK